MSLTFLAFICGGFSSAYADCSAVNQDVLIESKNATAGSWENMRNNPGSLRFEIGRMLKVAELGIDSATAPKDFCPAGCKVSEKPLVFFSSVPEKFLSEYSDIPLCTKYLQQTTATPLQFNNKDFTKIDEFSKWFSDFSQGSGPEGKILYAKCDGACSPQYKSQLKPQPRGAYTADTSVICGPARDKDNNQFVVSVAYRWFCTQ